MIRDLLIRELAKFEGRPQIADRLLVYGNTPYVAWLVDRLCRDAGLPPHLAISTFSGLSGVPETRVEYVYFKRVLLSEAEIESKPEYDALMDALVTVYGASELWGELARYAYAHLVNLAIEIMVDAGHPVSTITEALNVGKSRVYKVRKDFLTRYIQEKGDNNDSEHDE